MTHEGFRQLLLEAVTQQNVLPLTSSCNLQCQFCSHLGIPPKLDIFTFPALPEAELKDLIPFLDSQNKIIIGESSTRLCEGEPFTHPKVLPLLCLLRERFPRTPLQITTNGTLLTEDTIMILRELGGSTPSGDPLLELVISFNCCDSPSRRKILGDIKPQRAIDGLQRCCDYSIPFHGSVVAVPHLTGWDNLEMTLRHLDAKGARTIRIFLPGTARFASAAKVRNDSAWTEINAFRRQLKGSLNCPLLLEPPLKEDLTALVEGVILGSPAQQAGVRDGDIITAVDGHKVCSGVMAFEMIKKAAVPVLKVVRGADSNTKALSSSSIELEITIEKKRGAFSGIAIAYDLAEEMMMAVTREVERCRASSPLLLTSQLAAPLWHDARLSSLIPAQTRISIVSNRFFGGTIRCAGLLTVSDLRQHISSLAEIDETDLLLIPRAPFDKRGQDLRGENYGELFNAFPKMCMAFLPR